MNKNTCPRKVGHVMTSPKNIYNYLEEAIKVKAFTDLLQPRACITMLLFAGKFTSQQTIKKAAHVCEGAQSGVVSSQIGNILPSEKKQEKLAFESPPELNFRQKSFLFLFATLAVFCLFKVTVLSCKATRLPQDRKTGICRLFGQGNFNNCLLFTDCIARTCLGFLALSFLSVTKRKHQHDSTEGLYKSHIHLLRKL